MQWGQGRGMAATQARHAFDEEAIRILSGGDVNLFHLRGTFRCSSNTELISKWWPQRDSCGSGPGPDLLDSRRGHPTQANTASNEILYAGGPDLTFEIHGATLRQQGDELGPTPPLA